MPVIEFRGNDRTRFQEALYSLRQAPTISDRIKRQIVFMSYPECNPTTLVGKKSAPYVQVEGGRDVSNSTTAAIARIFYAHQIDTQVRWADGTMLFFPVDNGVEPSSSALTQ